MKKFFILFCLIAPGVIPGSLFSQRLTGSWDIVAFQTLRVGEPGYTLSDIGNITFYKDNSGESNINYSLMGVEKNEQTPFKWTVSQKFIAIEGQESDFTRTWIIMENKSSRQKWQATDGKHTIYTLELKKQKK
ncbi:MAG: hypothetical protein LBS07_00245 [Prevotellaceae bacterium]|jgi:hypothetical protein|nr:hypothetical protein [Prevotellaceae bacterium]